MIIHSIHDLTDQVLVNLLKKGLSTVTNPKYIENYHPDFSNQPGNLFYILDQGRYRKGHGKYFIVEEDGKYICSAGWNEYDFDKNIALLLTRMYTEPKYRMNYYVANNILPLALKEAKDYKHIWFTCNEYNKKIYDWFVRVEQGKLGGLFNNWPDIYKQFKPIGKRIVYNTDQYVAEYKNNEYH
jgi:hypothetical protein